MLQRLMNGRTLQDGALTRAHLHHPLTVRTGLPVWSLAQKQPEGWRVVAHLHSTPARRGWSPFGRWLMDARVLVDAGKAERARARGARTLNAWIEGTLSASAPWPTETGDTPRPNGDWEVLPHLAYVNDVHGARFEVRSSHDGSRLSRDVASMGRIPAVRLAANGACVAGWERMVWKNALNG